MNTITSAERLEFATFWNRLGAYLIDIILVGGFTALFNVINIANFKSFLLYFVIATIAISYKPLMESYYGATLGKMILKLKVSNFNFNKIDLKQSIIRSFIFIITSLLYFPIYYLAFNNPDFAITTQMFEFSAGVLNKYPIQSWIGRLSFILITIDVVFLLTDSTKERKSFHDRLAKTYVIIDR